MVIEEIGWAMADDMAPAFTKFLRSLPASPRLLGLGEPTHWVDAFPRVRNQIFQYLVEHHGYRAIALESGCMAGLLVNSYVLDGTGSLDDVMRHGFTHEFGKFEANRELVRWMRSYNENRSADRVQFFGFDGPLEPTHAESPRQALTALNEYLGSPYKVDELLGDDARWTNSKAVMDPTQSVGSSDDVARLRLITDDLIHDLNAQSPRLIAETSWDAWWLACLHGRTAAGLLRYHTAMAKTGPTRIAYLGGIRDAMMAENLKAIADHGKTLVFAHNQHLRRDLSSMHFAGAIQEWWTAGAIVSAQLGDQYAFLATAVGTAPEMDIGMPEPDSLEGVLSTLPEDRYILNPGDLITALAGRELAQRTADYRYFPLEPATVGDADGVLFLKSS